MPPQPVQAPDATLPGGLLSRAGLRRRQGPVAIPTTTGEALTGRRMGRGLGALYASAGVLVFVWVLLPHRGHDGDRVVALMAGVALVWGLTMLVGVADNASRSFFAVALALIQVVITVAYVGIGDPDNDIRLFYAWAAPYAAFYFDRAAAARHTGWVGALLAASLVAQRVPFAAAVSVWSTTVGLVVAVTVVVSWATMKMRRSEDRLQHAALHDPLTGLPNRVMWAHRASEALRRRDIEGGSVFVLLVDLDNFKLVNDTHGHAVGDEVLTQVAPRLVGAVRAEDTVARLGGDEFAVVCYDRTGELDVTTVARRLAATWERAFRLEHGQVWMTGSIGIVAAAASGRSAAELLRDADAAMYEAKAAGRNEYAVFDEAMSHQGQHRLEMINALHGALGRGEFTVVYQPIVTLPDAGLRGAEALLRWTSPTLGDVSPVQFIPLAEQTGMTHELTAFVLRRAMTQIAELRMSGAVPETFYVSVNVSAMDLTGSFPDLVGALLDSTRLPARRLALEITETSLLGNGPGVDDVVRRLRRLGVSLHLDDFGSGYSSLTHLERLPVDGLKIDRAFLPSGTAPASRWAVVAAIIAMARALGLHVTAEGVETAQQARALQDLGCRLVQGWLFGRPGPAEALLRMHAESVARSGLTAGADSSDSWLSAEDNRVLDELDELD